MLKTWLVPEKLYTCQPAQPLLPSQPFPPAARAPAPRPAQPLLPARLTYALGSPMCPDSETFSASGVSLRDSMSTTPATATGMMAANIGTMASL